MTTAPAPNETFPSPPRRKQYVRDIRLIFEHPPIGDRAYDWRALHDGDDEAPWAHGWGHTAQEALADLQRLDLEHEEYLDWLDTNEHSRWIESEDQRLQEEYP